MTIRNITTRIGAALALGILGLTQAESLANSYAFHYTFGDGTTINGTLDGTPNGDIVEDVMNVHYKVNGIVGPDARDSEWVHLALAS